MKVVAHRGASHLAPENTMAAFRLAQELGADGVELDVHATRDGELVVIHDYVLDRTTDGTGVILDVSFATVSTLDAGCWFSADFAGERVPRLHEVLALESLEFEVELKTPTWDAMRGARRAVQQAGVLDRTEFTSSNTPMLMALKDECPDARIGLFSPRREPWMPDTVFEHMIVGRARFVPADVVHVYAGDITPAVTEQLHDLGRIVHANDASGVDDVRRAVECGADRMTVDDPRPALALRAALPDGT